MAKGNSTNGSSSPDSEKASAPSPLSSSSSSRSSDDSDSPQKAPSKSPPSPSPPSPSPPSPPPPSHSPPPAPSPSPPPPTPPHSPPPKSSPPPQSSPPSKGSAPPPKPPSSPPPTPPSSPPPSSPPPTLPSPPPPNDNSPPSNDDSPPSTNNSPPPSESKSPPPPPLFVTPPSPPSHVTSPPQPPTSAPNHPLPPQSPVPISSGSHSKPSGSPSKSHSPSPSTSASPPSGNNAGQYLGFSLAAVFLVAFIAVILFFVLRKKNKHGDVYALPPPKKSQMKGDVHYYVDEPGFDGFYSSQQRNGVQHLRTPSDPGQQWNAGQMFFSYDKIVEITNGFSSENVIGEGGFGYVYKASMPDGRVGAVKLLKAGSGQGEREFRAEVDIISRIHHRHLVSLIGYCSSEQQRVLIYEYVPNGNLSQHLHGNGIILDWPKRVKIAIGAARGLAYLHEGCNPKIIHRDIKSANILLDNAYEAQVADFGLARLTDDAYTHVSTRVMGTFGYMAPEYATSGKLTDRSDVFSFGVVLLELVTGRKPVDPTQPVGDESLVEWARQLLLRAIETGDFSELVDPRLESNYVDSEMFRMIEAAAACVRHSAPKRPSMVQVARALDSGDPYDLSNGVKYGQSTIYDSGQYNADIMRFRRMVNGSFDDSEYDMYSSEYGTREMSGPQQAWMPQGSSGDSEKEFSKAKGAVLSTGLEITQLPEQ